MKRLFFTILLITISLFSDETREIEIQMTSSPPKIDGDLNDSCWKEALPLGELIQREPNPGLPATEKTEVKLIFDKEKLYIGLHCFDSHPKGIVANSMARDAELEDEDRIEIVIDPFLDKRSGYLFGINPLGAMTDALIGENGSFINTEWNAIWDARARKVSDGWTAEIAIPFQSLSFKPSLDTWGFNVSRYIKRKLEEDRWNAARLDIQSITQVSEAGRIRGISGISQGHGIDAKPYGLIGHSWEKETDTKKIPADIGGDVIYRITPSLTSIFTLNTDFAETEVDTREINLTRFPLFFPEKRTFFLEGAGVFNFGESSGEMWHEGSDFLPFFSRKIGLAEGGTPIPIMGGLKLFGRTGNYEIGFLDVITDKMDRLPRENYLITRVKRSLWDQSYAGAIFTSGNPERDEKSYLAGFDFQYRTSKFLGNKNFNFLFYGLKTKTEGIKGKDNAFGLKLGYPNDLFDASFSWKQIEKNFNPALGFLSRSDIRKASLDFTCAPRPRALGIRHLNFELRWEETMDLHNRPLARSIFSAPLNIEFESGERFEFNIMPAYDNVEEDFNIFKDIVVPRGEYSQTRFGVQFASASKRPISLDVQYWWGNFYGGKSIEKELEFHFNSGQHLIFELSLEHNEISIPNGTFTAKIYQLRVDYSFTPRLTLYNYVQYDNDSNNIGLNTRLRWIISPGNEIFFVINHSWINYEDRFDRFTRFVSYSSDLRFKIGYTYRL